MATPGSDRSAILFVDDEPHILAALRRDLRPWALGRSLDLLTAGSAEEALGILEAGPGRVGLIVSDQRMPGMSGSDFLLEVSSRHPGIPAMLLTGFSDPEGLMTAVRAGIFSCVSKPWEPDVLRHELEKALDLDQLRRESEARARELAEDQGWAGEMERALLKPSPFEGGGLEFQWATRPMRDLDCSGDYADILPLGPDRQLLLLGDITGHGVQAAFVAVMLKAVILAEYAHEAGTDHSPAAFLSWLGGRLYPLLRNSPGLLITLFAAVVDREARELRFANAGQTNPLVVRGGKVATLASSGPALGLLPEPRYREAALPFGPGDLFLAFTDGLAALGKAEEGGAETFPGASPAVLAATLAYGPDYPDRLLDAILQAAGERDFGDDATALSLYWA